MLKVRSNQRARQFFSGANINGKNLYSFLVYLPYALILLLLGAASSLADSLNSVKKNQEESPQIETLRLAPIERLNLSGLELKVGDTPKEKTKDWAIETMCGPGCN